MTHRIWPLCLRYFNYWRLPCRLRSPSGRSSWLPRSRVNEGIWQFQWQSVVRSAFFPSRSLLLYFPESSFQEEEGCRFRASGSQVQYEDDQNRCIFSLRRFCHFYPLPEVRRTYFHFIHDVSWFILGIWELNPEAFIIVLLLKHKSLQVLL